MAQNKTISEIAQHVGGRVIGDDSLVVTRIADLQAAGPGELAYVEDEKSFEKAKSSEATCLIVTDSFITASTRSEETGQALIVVSRPKLAFALAADLLHPLQRREPLVHPTAVISDTADVALTAYVGPHVTIGDGVHMGVNTRLEAGVVVGANVTIGTDCILHPNVVLYEGVTLGDRVILHAGV